MLHRRWWEGFLFALLPMLVTLAVAVEALRGYAIREARQKAIERGDIPVEKNFGK